jgi:hypothetical protein
MEMLAARGLTAAVLEIVVGGVGGGFLQVSQDRFGTPDGEVAQEAGSAFPEFEVGDLDEVLDQ